MLMIPRQVLNDVLTVTSQISYSKLCAKYSWWLWFSRLPIIKNTRRGVLEPQKAIAVFIEAHQKNIREFNSQIKKLKEKFSKIRDKSLTADINFNLRLLLNSEGQYKKLKELGLSKLYQRQIVRFLKEIADGITWRNYQFNRGWISIMSRQKSGGDLKVDMKSVFNLAEQMSTDKKEKFKILIHDITRFLRVGDISIIWCKEGNKILLSEVKKRGDKIMQYHLFNFPPTVGTQSAIALQFKKLFNAQRQLWDEEVYAYGEKLKIIYPDVYLRHHFKSVKKLIRSAKRRGIASIYIEDYATVQCMDFQSIRKREIKIDKYDPMPHPTGRKEGDWLAFYSNLDTFYDIKDHFLRNVAPYSVFPFSNKVCTKLMSNEMGLITEISITHVMRRIEEFGYSVIPEDINKYGNFCTVHDEEGKFLTLDLLIISRMAYEFMSMQTLKDLINFYFTRTLKFNDYFTMGRFKNEDKVYK